MKRRRDSRRELARKISGAKLKEPPEPVPDDAVWAMKESGGRLSFPPLREAENSFFKRRLRRIKTDTETGSKAGSIRPPRRDPGRA